MRKEILLVLNIILLISFLLLTPIKAQAQSTVIGVRTACLEATSCTEVGSKCTKKDISEDYFLPFHSANLYTKDKGVITRNTKAYILECFSVDGKQICTTGSADLDKEAFCSLQNVTDVTLAPGSKNSKELCDQNINNLDTLKNKFSYTFDYIFKNIAGKMQPSTIRSLIADEIGKIESNVNPYIVWGSGTTEFIPRKFILYQPFTDTAVVKDSVGALQQSNLAFVGSPERCTSISWDPTGRVFDSLSLEPIPQSSIYLYKNYNGEYKDAKQTEYNIANPFRTDSAGVFSFIVNDGLYRLSPESDSKYAFDISSLSTIQKNYKLIYSNIYPAERGRDIAQKGKMEQRDIPLRPINGTGNSYPLKIISLFTDVIKMNGSISYDGNVSHPFSIIRVYYLKSSGSTVSRGDLAYIGQTDKMGLFSFEVPGNSTDPSQYLGEVEFEKVNLTTDFLIPTQYPKLSSTSAFLNVSSAQNISGRVTLRHDPIPNNLQGVAKINGKVVSNGTVQVYTDFSNVPFHTTHTNANGEFSIASDVLPSMPYKIKYISKEGIKLDISTTQFIQENQNTMINATYNPVDFLDKSGKKVSSADLQKIYKKNNLGIENKQDKSNEDQSSLLVANQTGSSQMVLIIMVILVLLGVTTAILTIYVIKRGKVPYM
ncbi:MAG: carboxypeptidase-like regulatory domain-containing protein [Candidatus Roizmanbacteria bacterium]